jgi:1,6-anhydro-N-acetylmuramate kinase
MKVRLGRREAPKQRPAPPPKRVERQPSRGERREQRARMVVGCMTGTSIDGIDVALVRIHGHGYAMRAEHVRGASRDFGALGKDLRRLAEQQPLPAREIARLARDLALVHLDAIGDLGAERIDLVVAHGQTVFHAPPLSWQLLNPAPIAYTLGVPVVSDLRAADLARGGQGAPITPLADHVLFRGGEPRAVVNLGGFCNITLLPGGDDGTRIRGGDVCACNQVLDHLARELFNEAYDRGGERAERGRVEKRALAALAAQLALQAKGGRSLGTGDELGEWVARWRERTPPADLARTACAAIAQTIAKACSGAKRLVLAGGGVRNRALVAEISQRAGAPVVASDKLGVPAAMREAMGMAVLGALCQDRVAITVSAITGVESPPISGSWTLP